MYELLLAFYAVFCTHGWEETKVRKVVLSNREVNIK